MIYESAIERIRDVANMSIPSAIQTLEEVAKELLADRAQLLEYLGELQGEGFYPKYFVFNNLTRHTDDDTFVLDPKNSPVDMDAIEFYANNTDNKELSKCLQDWVFSHKNFTCPYPVRENCPIVGYNLCCGHCPNKDACYIDGNIHLCNKVASDTFISVEECKDNEC